MTTEEIVPTPNKSPTVAMEFWLDMILMTKPQHVRTEPELRMVGMAAETAPDSASNFSDFLRSAA